MIKHKDLEWAESATTLHLEDATFSDQAGGACGCYEVLRHRGNTQFLAARTEERGVQDLGRFKTASEAKLACQADADAFIREFAVVDNSEVDTEC